MKFKRKNGHNFLKTHKDHVIVYKSIFIYKYVLYVIM